MNSKRYGDPRAHTPLPPVTMLARPDQAHSHLVVSVESETAAAAGVQLKDLRFDCAVQQRPLGLEEVELSLPVDGSAELLLPR